MKVGIFDPYLDAMGGGEKYMLSIALCLSEHHDVSIFWDSEIEKIISQAKKRFSFDLEKIKFAKNIFSKDCSFLKRNNIAKEYDSIIFLSDGSIPVLFKKNLVVHFQFPVEWTRPNLFGKLKLAMVKKIIVNSVFTKDYIDRKFGVNSVVIYPPVDLPKANVKKENMILNVGRLSISPTGENFKKQDLMINFFKRMVEDNKNEDWKFVLVISVKDEDKEKLKKLKSMADGFPIEIIENPTHEKLWELYVKAKIYWHAAGFGENLNTHPELAEHFGIATCEAMNAGAVPVVIDAGGQKEIVEDGKNGFLWKNYEELSEKTHKLISDEKLLGKLSDAAKRSSQKFSVDRFCDEITRELTYGK